MSVSFGGIGEVVVTFEAAEGTTAGQPVKMTDSGKVMACASGDRMCGVALFAAEDGHAAVQLRGYVKLGYTGTAPTVGYGYLKAAADGKVAAATSTTGGEYLIIDTDTDAKTVGFYI